MFEYKVVRLNAGNVEAELNELAQQGWECIGAHPDPMNYLTTIAILKRQTTKTEREKHYPTHDEIWKDNPAV